MAKKKPGAPLAGEASGFERVSRVLQRSLRDIHRVQRRRFVSGRLGLRKVGDELRTNLHRNHVLGSASVDRKDRHVVLQYLDRGNGEVLPLCNPLVTGVGSLRRFIPIVLATHTFQADMDRDVDDEAHRAFHDLGRSRHQDHVLTLRWGARPADDDSSAGFLGNGLELGDDHLMDGVVGDVPTTLQCLAVLGREQVRITLDLVPDVLAHIQQDAASQPLAEEGNQLVGLRGLTGPGTAEQVNTPNL